MSEFLQEKIETPTEEEMISTEDIDVQKAVVESLAADKALQDEHINSLLKKNAALKSELSTLRQQIEEMRQELANVGDVLAKNSEVNESHKIALLERHIEIEDRFVGESRDQLLEVIREARQEAEKDGRNRRAQILEGILLANEPVGSLAKKRQELEKVFSENGNVITGTVLEFLTKLGISHKKGEKYLLPSEIIKQNY